MAGRLGSLGPLTDLIEELTRREPPDQFAVAALKKQPRAHSSRALRSPTAMSARDGRFVVGRWTELF